MSRNCKISNIDLHNATIDGHFEISKASVDGKINLLSSKIYKSVLIRKSTISGGLFMTGAYISDDIDISGSKIHNILLMDNINVNRNLILSKNEQRTSFCRIILSGAVITGAFFIIEPKYCNDAIIDLRYAKFGLIVDSINAWPKNIRLNNFVYKGFVLIDNTSPNNIKERNVDWYIKWLEKNKNYSSQPYFHLSTKLVESGRIDDSKKILYESRKKRHQKINNILSWVWESIQFVYIGYGYRVYYCIYWFVGFALIGTLILKFSGQGKKNSMPYGISYSIDMLLPIIRLNEYHYTKVRLNSWVKYYFYMHKIMGYILVSFLIVGLSGLTK
jgi:hypothetical protein